MFYKFKAISKHLHFSQSTKDSFYNLGYLAVILTAIPVIAFHKMMNKGKMPFADAVKDFYPETIQGLCSTHDYNGLVRVLKHHPYRSLEDCLNQVAPIIVKTNFGLMKKLIETKDLQQLATESKSSYQLNITNLEQHVPTYQLNTAKNYLHSLNQDDLGYQHSFFSFKKKR